jgi:hypothetical protein
VRNGGASSDPTGGAGVPTPRRRGEPLERGRAIAREDGAFRRASAGAAGAVLAASLLLVALSAGTPSARAGGSGQGTAGPPTAVPGGSPRPADAALQATPTATPPPDDGSRGLNPGFTNVGAAGGRSAALATLAPQGDSGVRGEAVLLQFGDMTTIVVLLGGLAPEGLYRGYVRSGGCDGPTLATLESIRADDAGLGRATSTLDSTLEPSDWWIDYRVDESPLRPAIVCGPVGAGR